ncbi:MAG: SDR family oxidoreductase [Planctomycetota bacterium]|nr:SDR family oxidoreductase [Planctomycetota bacterium]
MIRLNDKVVLITGAARGIGEACAAALATEGARVYVTDIEVAGIQRVASAIGPRAYASELDVRREEHWQRVIDGILAAEARLDVLINNAGITGFVPPMGPHDPESASLEAWRAVHETNLDGVFLGCKHAIAAMKPRPGVTGGGSIINISSRSGQVGIPRAAAYASSKAAVRNHSKTVALYCAEMGYNIRCNSIHPGAILTPMWEPMLGDSDASRDAAIAQIASDIPLQRMGTAHDVAMMAVYLASDESTYVTGAEFVIDGGILAGSAATPRQK